MLSCHSSSVLWMPSVTSASCIPTSNQTTSCLLVRATSRSNWSTLGLPCLLQQPHQGCTCSQCPAGAFTLNVFCCFTSSFADTSDSPADFSSSPLVFPLQVSRNTPRPALQPRHWHVVMWLPPRVALPPRTSLPSGHRLCNGEWDTWATYTSEQQVVPNGCAYFPPADEADRPASGSARGPPALCWKVHQVILHAGGSI